MSVHLSSKAGEALTFFASFFVSRQKEGVGFGAKPSKAYSEIIELFLAVFSTLKNLYITPNLENINSLSNSDRFCCRSSSIVITKGAVYFVIAE
ncbi:MAG: hypothetical protein GX879_04895 [Bacteroidales bacterium]|nr:hypothetical protein [Bacteroidales bacterium]